MYDLFMIGSHIRLSPQNRRCADLQLLETNYYLCTLFLQTIATDKISDCIFTHIYIFK